MNIKQTLILLALAVLPLFSIAQNGEFRGTVTELDGAPAPEASIRLLQNSQYVKGAITDEDGTFSFKLLPPGDYEMMVYFLDMKKTFPFTIAPGQTLVRSFSMVTEEELDLITVRTVKTGTGGETLDSITETTPTIDPVDLITGLVGVNPVGNGGFAFAGSRTDATRVIMDNQPNLSGAVPQNGFDVQSIGVQASGVRAQYGGFTGGAVVFSTKMPSIKREVRFDLTSSALTSAFNQNRLHSYMTGPLKTQKFKLDDGEEQTRMILGYTLATYLTYNKDNRPLMGGMNAVSDDALQQLYNQPLTSSEKVGSQVMSTNFIDQNDIQQLKAQQNASLYNATTRFKLAYSPRERTSLVLNARGGYSQQQLVSLNNSLLNSERNPLRTNANYTVGFDYNQTLKAPYDSRGNATYDSNDLFSHIYYTVQGSYQSSHTKTMDPIHKDRIFDYGDVGRFTTYTAPVYEFRPDVSKTIIDQHGNKVNVRNYYEYTGTRDTAITFSGSGKNPLLSNVNNAIFGLQGSEFNSITDFSESDGIVNGYNAQSLYSLYNNPGAIVTNYNKTHLERISLTAMGEAAFHPTRKRSVQHDLQFGVQFEQNSRSYYSLAAQRLWRLMPLLANNHISELDKENPILTYDEQGRFTDTIVYERKINIEDQKHFDQQLRNKLIAQGATDVYGNPVDEQTWIDVNSLDPEVFTLDMFTADELLNDGNGYVSYSGYDHLGNRRRGKTSLNDFLNDPSNRPMDSYTPNYTAAWIEDKFVYKDLQMRLGARVERYDANQAVLADPYSFFPVKKASEVTEINGMKVNIPAGIGDDYAVYVNNMNTPTEIVGFRNGNEWFDANGIRVADPNLLSRATSNGKIQPYLVDPENQVINKGSFNSFEPIISLLPRVFFSFPINSTAVFFASYDKLAQRPPNAQSYVPLATYYNIQSFTNSVIPNANMKPRIRTAYDLGFKQLIGRRAQLELRTTYSTIRNDFNQIRLEQAYPFSYTTYSNVDFSTVKTYSAEYRFNAKVLNLMGSYTLQFADGTGSNVNSASTLIQSGQPNLRSLYPLSFDVRHSLKGTAVLQLGRMESVVRKPITGMLFRNAYMSFNMRSLSGTPYTSTIAPVAEAQAASGVAIRTQVKGQPFGSRMPWQHNIDLKYEKNIPLKVDFDSMNMRIKVRSSMSFYVMVNNVLNNMQIFNVYSYTGSPNDDGYLNSPQGQQNIAGQLSAETFTQLYKMRMDNPYNMAEPRQVKIGFKFNFL